MTQQSQSLLQARAARPSDAEPLLSVLCAAFGIDAVAARPLFYQDPYYDLSLKRVLASPQHGIVSCLTIIPATLEIGGARIPTGGIAGVATHPAHQRQGYASRLLSETTDALASELYYSISALFPYSEVFYRRLGWETASRAASWAGHAPAPSPYLRLASRIRLLHPDSEADRQIVRRLHAAAPVEQTGLCRRDARRWHILEAMNKSWEWYLHETRGKLTGYAACEIVAGHEPIIRVHEIITASADAAKGLLAFIAHRRGPQTFIAWTDAPGRHAQFGLPETPDRLSCVPGMMLQITDLQAALKCLHVAYAPTLAETNRTLTIITDNHTQPDDLQAVRLSASGVTTGSTADANWLRMDIRVLAQFYTGFRLPSDAVLEGDARCSSPAALSLADQIFPRRNPFIAPADQF